MTLTIADIADQRAYEREREVFRAEVIALKKIRRVPIGPLLTVVCENRTTIRFQIQEMARAEKMATDAQIQAELDTYNPLIPGPGEISLTLFLELTNDEDLREWLPRLVGIERALVLELGEGDSARRVAVEVDRAHAAQLTREEVTASVHYVRFILDGGAQEAFRKGPAAFVADHPAYAHRALLTDLTRESIAVDWNPSAG